MLTTIKKTRPTFLVMIMLASTAAQAASVREVIRSCGDDGKKYCEGVRYGQPMQTCLSKNKTKLEPTCQALMDRLEAGEKVTLF